MTFGVVWLDGPLAVLSLGIGLLYTVMVITRKARPTSGLAHALMGVGMAAMFVPRFDPLPRAGWVAIFVLIGAWFGATALREGRRFGEPAHHVVGAAAMVFMLLAHRHDTAPAAAVEPAHAHHGAAAGGGTAAFSALALVLAAYFVAHAVHHLLARGPADAVPGLPGRGSADAEPAPAGAIGVLARVSAQRAVPASHVVMGATMAVMLLGRV
ncbi:MAG: DUF5134 domain-containing protein [Pseudonocardia sp.]